MKKMHTLIEVVYPAYRGRIGLRGSDAPLSWESTMAATHQHGDLHLFELHLPSGTLVDVKLVRNEDSWAEGRHHQVHAGDHLHLEPHFDETAGRLLPAEKLETPSGTLRFQVMLPPGYTEQESLRLPVLYVLDGQSLWSTSNDPYGVWNLDGTLGQLWDLGAAERFIVVGIETGEDRLQRLSPFKDPEHGGGGGPNLLNAITDGLVPHINATYRTLTGRDHTAIMGSSMGGLFAFYAGWTAPGVFGRAASLSGSFWWANRVLIQKVQEGPVPDPRPQFYLDSGAAMNGMEQDPNLKDGFHHTRSMQRALLRLGFKPGVDLHRFTFAGQAHNADAWAMRVAIPLQMLFPPTSVGQVPQPLAPAGQEGAPT
jgi:predicted alpha/beta superfamily hydrolase